MKRQQPPVWKLKLGIALSFTGVAIAIGLCAAMLLSLAFPGLRAAIIAVIPCSQVAVPAFVMIGILLILSHLLPEIGDEGATL